MKTISLEKETIAQSNKETVDEKDSWLSYLPLLFFIIMTIFSIIVFISCLSSNEKPDDTTDVQKVLSIIKYMAMILSSLSFVKGGFEILEEACTHDETYGYKAAAHAVLGIICMGGAIAIIVSR